MRTVPHLLALLIGAALAGTAGAADGPGLLCQNGGNNYHVGEFACIAACHGERRLARCDVIAEKASWTFVSNSCPSALLPDAPDDTNLRPVSVAMTPIPLAIEHVMSEMSAEAWMKLVDTRKALVAGR